MPVSIARLPEKMYLKDYELFSWEKLDTLLRRSTRIQLQPNTQTIVTPESMKHNPHKFSIEVITFDNVLQTGVIRIRQNSRASYLHVPNITTGRLEVEYGPGVYSLGQRRDKFPLVEDNEKEIWVEETVVWSHSATLKKTLDT